MELVSTITNNTVKAPQAPRAASQAVAMVLKAAKKADGIQKLHAVWVFPVNAVVNALAFLLQPVVSAIVLIAAVVFEVMSCFNKDYDWHYVATRCVKNSLGSMMTMHMFLIRIVYPFYKYDDLEVIYGFEKEDVNSLQGA